MSNEFTEFTAAAQNEDQGGKTKVICSGDTFLTPLTLEGIAVYHFAYSDYSSCSNAVFTTVAKSLSHSGSNKVKGMGLIEHFDFISSHDANGNETGWQNSELYGVIKKIHTDFYVEMIECITTVISEFLEEQINDWYYSGKESLVPVKTKNLLSGWVKNNMLPEYLYRVMSINSTLNKELGRFYESVLQKLNIPPNFFITGNVCSNYETDFYTALSANASCFYEQVRQNVKQFNFSKNVYGDDRKSEVEKMTSSAQKWCNNIKKNVNPVLFSQSIHEQLIAECAADIKKEIKEICTDINTGEFF